MADSRADSLTTPRPRRPIEPAALPILGVAALAVAALLLFGPAGGALGMMLAVVVAFAIIHVGCLVVGCGMFARRDGGKDPRA